MRFKILLLMVLLVCVSCAHEYKIINSVPKERVHYYTEVDESESTITIVSDVAPFYHFTRRRIFIVIDNRDIIEFRHKEAFIAKVAPGKHTLSIAELFSDGTIGIKYSRKIYINDEDSDTYHIFIDGLGNYELIWK